MEPQNERKNSFNFEIALKQFSLESERLDWIYQSLEKRFDSIQKSLNESQLHLSARLAELNFINIYFKKILDHISQGILFINSQGIVTTYSRAAQNILGVEEKKLLFHPFHPLFSDDFFGFSLTNALQTQISPKMSHIKWQKSLEEELQLEIETTFVFDVTPFAIDSFCVKQSFSHGLLIIIRDVTEMRRLQLVVNRHDVLKELGEMAAHLAHEIRNPLGGIKGFASLLYQDLQNQPNLQPLAAQILQGTDSLNHLVTTILNYTRIPELSLEETELIGFFQALKQWIEADPAWNQQINFTVHCEENQLIASIDRSLFKSAMLNLIINASQAISEKGSIYIEIKKQESNALIAISDTGCGINPANLSKIFSPFFTTKARGTGLGLAEVHKVIQTHAGEITVNSKLGEGSCFRVKIPLKIKE